MLSENERGVVHLVPVLLLLAVAAVVITSAILVQRRTSTKPKATSTQTLSERTNQLLQSAGKGAGSIRAEGSTQISAYQVAVERKEAMVKSANENPAEFLRNALPETITRRLPQPIQSLVERPKEVSGTITVIHYDDFQNNKSRESVTLSDGTTTYQLKIAKPADRLLTGSRVTAKGIALDNILVVDTIEPITLSRDVPRSPYPLQIQSQPTIATTNDHKTAVVLINTFDTKTYPFTPEHIRTLMFEADNSVDRIFREFSGNRISFSGQIYGWFDVKADNNQCTDYQWGDATLDRLRQQGVDPTSFANVLYIISSPQCSFEGFASVGGRDAFVNGQQYPDDPARNLAWISNIAVHEIGHNLGLHHANGYLCDNQPIGNDAHCRSIEYGDPSDVMGSGDGLGGENFLPTSLHFNAPHKLALGWIPSSKVRTIDEFQGGTFAIGRTNSTVSTLPELVKIKKPHSPIYNDTAPHYYISYRNPTGLDVRLPEKFTTGASVHIWDGKIARQTHLVDSTVPVATSSAYYNYYFSDAPLQDDAEIKDPNGITIKQDSHTENNVTLTISTDLARCVRANPEVETLSGDTLYSEQDPTNPRAYIYGIEITNNDNLACEATVFRVTPTIPSDWTYTVVPQREGTEFTVAQGMRKSKLFAVTPAPSAPDGAYEISFLVEDTRDTTRKQTVTLPFYIFSPPTPSPSPSPLPSVVSKNLTMKFKLHGRRETVGPGFAEPFRLTLTVDGSDGLVDLIRATDSTGTYRTTANVLPGRPYKAVLKARHSVPITMKPIVFDYSDNALLDFGTIPNGNAREDNAVNILDFSLFARSFGKSRSQSGFNADADFNGDGGVNILDFSILAASFGKSTIAIPGPASSPSPRPVSAPVQ